MEAWRGPPKTYMEIISKVPVLYETLLKHLDRSSLLACRATCREWRDWVDSQWPDVEQTLVNPLHMAAATDNVEGLERQLLLVRNADIEVKTCAPTLIDEDHGWPFMAWILSTPLVVACLESANNAIEFLLAQGADSKVRNSYDMTPLEICLELHNLVGYNMLLSHYIPPRFATHLILDRIEKSIPLPFLEGLLPHIDVNQVDGYLNGSLLTEAVQNKDLEGAECLINHGANLEVANVRFETPLEIAVKHENLPMMRLLLSKNAATMKPCARCYYEEASLDGCESQVSCLEDHLETPSHDSTWKVVITTLLDHGIELNVRRLIDGKTPLNQLMKCFKDQEYSFGTLFSLCKQMLEKGANPNIEYESCSPLRAVGYLLLQRKDNCECCGYEVSQLRDLLVLLIQNGADVHHQSQVVGLHQQGETVLELVFKEHYQGKWTVRGEWHQQGIWIGIHRLLRGVITSDELRCPDCRRPMEYASTLCQNCVNDIAILVQDDEPMPFQPEKRPYAVLCPQHQLDIKGAPCSQSNCFMAARFPSFNSLAGIEDILLLVASYMTQSELRNMRLVSKMWRNVVDSKESLWTQATPLLMAAATDNASYATQLIEGTFLFFPFFLQKRESLKEKKNIFAGGANPSAWTVVIEEDFAETPISIACKNSANGVIRVLMKEEVQVQPEWLLECYHAGNLQGFKLALPRVTEMDNMEKYMLMREHGEEALPYIRALVVRVPLYCGSNIKKVKR